MRSVLIQFQNGIEEIRKFIEGIQIQKRAINTFRRATNKNIQPSELDELMQRFVESSENFSTKSAFDYNTIVVSMYGYFERFIEDLIKAYIISLKSSVKDFNEMPEKIRANHSELSATLIHNLKLPKYQGLITNERIIINMHSCIVGNPEFEINLDAYTYHTSNFRQGSIDEFFSKVGVENISGKIVNYPKFESFLSENEISKSIAFEKINDLAERRNQVSHGAPVQLLDPTIFLDYLDFFERYGDCLLQILMIELVKYRVEHTLNTISLDSPIKIYGNNIVCFELNNIVVSVGDEIYARTNNGTEPYRFGIIESIRVNDEDVSSIESQEGLQVGFKVNFKVGENYHYFIAAVNEELQLIV